MAFEERNTWVYLLVSLAVMLIFGTRIYDATVMGAFDGPEGLQTWARRVLTYIPMAIVMVIVTVILANIVYGIFTGGDDLTMKEDERDRHIGLRGMRVTQAVFSTGWIIAVVLLALGYSALQTLNLMLLAAWFSDVAGNLVKLFFYRRGY